MSKLKIGAQLYTIRDFMKTPDDMAVSLKKIHDIGFETVQVSGIGPIDWENDLSALLKENQLQCVATHVPLDRMENDLDKLVREHQAIGSPLMGIGAMPPEFRSEEGCKAFAQRMNRIGQNLKGSGIKLSYHNHRFEFFRTPDCSRTGMDILIQETDPECVEFILDTFWIVAGGANPIDYIKMCPGRNQVIHYKDMVIVDDQQEMTECGCGNINFAAITPVCEEMGVVHAVIEQDICKRDPFESLAISFKNLTK